MTVMAYQLDGLEQNLIASRWKARKWMTFFFFLKKSTEGIPIIPSFRSPYKWQGKYKTVRKVDLVMSKQHVPAINWQLSAILLIPLIPPTVVTIGACHYGLWNPLMPAQFFFPLIWLLTSKLAFLPDLQLEVLPSSLRLKGVTSCSTLPLEPISLLNNVSPVEFTHK